MSQLAEKGRRRMIDGINQVSGRSDCREAIVLQGRSRLAVIGFGLAVGLVMAMIKQFVEIGALVSAGLFGLLFAFFSSLAAENYWLGHCEGTVVLVKVTGLTNRPLGIMAEYPYPVAASVDSGRIAKKVTVGERQYLLARQFEDRFRAITGIN